MATAATTKPSTKPTVSRSVTMDPIDEIIDAYKQIPSRLPAKGETPIPEYPGEEINAGGKTMYLRQTPNAGKAGMRQAVFVHGLGGSARNWTDLQYLLEPVCGSIAPDLLGFGQSPVPKDGDYSQRAHANAVIRMIEDRYSEPVDLFGNSMGGSISIRIAATRPDLVRSLTLVSPALPNPRPNPVVMPLLLLANPVTRALLAKVTSVTPEQSVDRQYALCYADTSMIHADRRSAAIKEAQWRMEREDYTAPLRQSALGLGKAFLPGSDNVLGYAAKIQCPTLAFFGTKDKLVDSRLANKLAATIEHSRVVTLPNIGHVAQLEVPVTVARMVMSMWAETSALSQG